MARPETLVPGNCYFDFGYHDEQLLLPHISTLIYSHTEEDEELRRLWIFRRLDVAESLAVPAEQLYGILELPGLMQKLQSVAADHPLHPPPARTSALLDSAGDFGELDRQLSRFFGDPGCRSLTVTILYTDDAFSLGRDKDGRIEMGFFPRPRLDAAKEARIIALFQAGGVRPHVDYLADRGRTRVLEFAVPQALDALTLICKRVLVEVHGMRADDRLRYSFLPQASL